MPRCNWTAGKRDAKILISALLTHANGELDDQTNVVISLNTRWEQTDLWVTRTTLQALQNLIRICNAGAILDIEDIRNSIHCCQDLEILKDTREQHNPRTHNSSKWWSFYLTLRSIDREENIQWLFPNGHEWDRRRQKRRTGITFEQPTEIYESEAANTSYQQHRGETNLREHPTQQDWLETPMISSNPFNDRGCIQNPARFFDREQILKDLLNGLSQGHNYSLIGDTQIGKSSILWRICHHIGSQELNMEPDNFIYLDMQCIHNTNEFFTALCYKLKFDQTYRGFELERNLKGQRYILCLDEIEKMTNLNNFTGEEQTELRGLSDGTDKPFALVIASRTPLPQLFPDLPERTSPLYNICSPIRLKGFSNDIAIKFINHRLQGTGVTFTEDQINELISTSQCNPAKLQNHAAHLYYTLTQE
ncbi:MAG TPA: hypothetical protein DD379_20220 [Cyanobacteria bacterium UBA11162]|nr:hypothetical protein [Cyanobacteria bacterium UBA11162]